MPSDDTAGQLVAYLVSLHLNDVEAIVAMKDQLAERSNDELLGAFVALFAWLSFMPRPCNRDDMLAMLSVFGARVS